MRQAVGYFRVSTAGQCQDGVSLEAQEARIRQWADTQGYELIELCRDNGISAKNLKARPGAQRAIDLACQHKAALVFYSLSRLARSTKEAIMIADRLRAAGADLVSLTEPFDTTTAMGNMIFQVLAALAEFERKLISERTTGALQYMKANHRRTGSVPYGYDCHDGALIDNPTEQAVIAMMRDWQADGVGLTEIVRRLNEQGTPTKQGGRWHRSTVRNILNPELRPRKKA
jgi:DNA invertase Pin-like site-specific DNA recombinase